MSHVNLLDTLTEREREVYDLMVMGYQAKKIAQELTFSYSTAKFHLANIYDKLEVSGYAEAIAYREQLRLAGVIGESKSVSSPRGVWGEAEIREAASALIANGLGDRKTVNQMVTDLLMALEGRL
jgi:DNA-binding CsgD family transcriptional regulator